MREGDEGWAGLTESDYGYECEGEKRGEGVGEQEAAVEEQQRQQRRQKRRTIGTVLLQHGVYTLRNYHDDDDNDDDDDDGDGEVWQGGWLKGYPHSERER